MDQDEKRGGGATVPYDAPCVEDWNGVAWFTIRGVRGGAYEIRAERTGGRLRRPHPPSSRGVLDSEGGAFDSLHGAPCNLSVRDLSAGTNSLPRVDLTRDVSSQ